MADAFALQLGESTDVLKDDQLLAFLCFVDQNEIQEELPEFTVSSEIFKAIDVFEWKAFSKKYEDGGIQVNTAA